MESTASDSVPEFSIFEIKEVGVAYTLPLAVPVVIYVFTRVKLMTLQEGSYGDGSESHNLNMW